MSEGPYRAIETEVNLEEEARKERIKIFENTVYEKLAAMQDNFVAAEKKFGEITSDYLGYGDTWNVLLQVKGLDSNVAQRLRESYYDSHKTDIDNIEGEKNNAEKIKLLRKIGQVIYKVIENLDGLDSSDSWFFREKMLREYELIKTNINYENNESNINFLRSAILENIGGCDSSTAWGFRRQCLREAQFGQEPKDEHSKHFFFNGYEQINNIPISLVKGLRELDGEEAWKIREQFIVKNEKERGIGHYDFKQIKEQSIYIMLHNLTGLDSDRAWQERDDYFQYAISIDDYKERHKLLSNIMDSIRGLDSDKAWELRELVENYFSGKYEDRIKYLENIQGIDSKKADILRKKYEGDRRAVINSIKGLNSKEAWRIRNKYIKDEPESILLSLRGISTPKSMEMRRILLDNDDNLVWAYTKSLQGLENTKEVLDLKEKLLERSEFNSSDFTILESLVALIS